MLILIEAFCRVALFVIQMLYAIQAKLSASYKNAKDNMYRRFIKVYYKNENEWLKTQLNKINKQPYHLILVMNNSVQLHHIIQLIQYVTLTNTKFVTIYDIKGQLAEHIPKLHSDILSKQFTKTYNQRTIQLNSFIQDKKQVQYEIKNEGEPLYIQFLDNSANQKDLLQLIKRSTQKNEDIVFERDLVSYKIINSIEGKDTVNMKSYSTALLIQFDHQFYGLYGLPFQFLKSSEMIFGQNILNFTYTKFLKSYQTYAYLQQREGK